MWTFILLLPIFIEASAVKQDTEEKQLLPIPQRQIPVFPVLTNDAVPVLLPNYPGEPLGSAVDIASNVGKQAAGVLNDVPVAGNSASGLLGGLGAIGSKGFNCKACTLLMPPIQWGMKKWKFVYNMVEDLCIKHLLHSKFACYMSLKSAQNVMPEVFCRKLKVCPAVSREAMMREEKGIVGLRENDYVILERMFANIGEHLDELQPLLKALEKIRDGVATMPPVQWGMKKWKFVYNMVEDLCIKHLLHSKFACYMSLKSAQNVMPEVFCRKLKVCPAVSRGVMREEKGIVGLREHDYVILERMFANIGEHLDELQPLLNALEKAEFEFV